MCENCQRQKEEKDLKETAPANQECHCSQCATEKCGCEHCE